ncbi:uncharacterized protein LOC144016440 [Festucalex cinctus]
MELPPLHHGGAGAYPSLLRAVGGVHPELVASQLQYSSLQDQRLSRIPEESELDSGAGASRPPDQQDGEERATSGSDEDDVPLRALVSERWSRSLSGGPSSYMTSRRDHLESAQLESPRRRSGQIAAHPDLWNQSGWSVKKERKRAVKRRRSRRKKSSLQYMYEQFPQWLVNVMINIEEATTHQLLIE